MAEEVADFLQGTITRLAAVGVGGYVLWRVLGRNQRLNECKQFRQQTQDQIELIMTGGLSAAEYEALAAENKNVVIALNEGLPADQRVDVAAQEDELVGRQADHRALQWTMLANRQALNCISNESNENAITRTISSLPPWAKTLVVIYGLAHTAVALAAVVAKLLEARDGGGGGGGGGGGVLDTLGDWTDSVRSGYFGDPQDAEQIESQPAPGETPQVLSDGTYVGSPRAAAQTVGAVDAAAWALDAMDMASDVQVDIAEATANAVADATNMTPTQRQNTALVLAAAIVIAGGAALALGSGGTTAPVAIGLVAVSLAAIGLSLNTDLVADVMGDVHADVTNQLSATQQGYR